MTSPFSNTSSKILDHTEYKQLSFCALPCQLLFPQNCPYPHSPLLFNQLFLLFLPLKSWQEKKQSGRFFYMLNPTTMNTVTKHSIKHTYL